MKFTNKHNLRPAFVAALKNDEYDYEENVYSTTTLIGPPRIKSLFKKHKKDIVIDVSDRVWTLLGTTTHEHAERQMPDRIEAERRYYMEIDRVKISGKSDVYDMVDHTIEDFKTTSKYAIRNNKWKPEWEQQLNVLAELLEQNDQPVKALYINAIIKDFNSRDYFDDSLPNSSVISIKIPLWPKTKRLAYIKSRLKDHLENPMRECTIEERWGSKDIYQVKKELGGRAIKNFEDRFEADEHARNKGYIVEVKSGEDKRCLKYCDVNKFCDFYINKYGDRNGLK